MIRANENSDDKFVSTPSSTKPTTLFRIISNIVPALQMCTSHFLEIPGTFAKLDGHLANNLVAYLDRKLKFLKMTQNHSSFICRETNF